MLPKFASCFATPGSPLHLATCSQQCVLGLRSYSFPLHQVAYSWRAGGLQFQDNETMLIVPEVTLVDTR